MKKETKTKKPMLMAHSEFDDFQTPDYALDYLVPYLKRGSIVFEPACGKGNIVRGLSKRGFIVISGDIKTGQDFLKLPIPQDIDVIITNPPFSIKNEFLRRCCESNLPFALLLPAAVFDSIERRKLMEDYGLSIIVPDKRISFETPNHEKNLLEGKKTGGSWFFTFWVVRGLTGDKSINFSKRAS